MVIQRLFSFKRKQPSIPGTKASIGNSENIFLQKKTAIHSRQKKHLIWFSLNIFFQKKTAIHSRHKSVKLGIQTRFSFKRKQTSIPGTSVCFGYSVRLQKHFNLLLVRFFHKKNQPSNPGNKKHLIWLLR